MALKSITGTTSEIRAALTANKIGIETSVTITDDSYNSTDLLDIIKETNKTITLQKTAAWTPISDTPENLVKILAQVNKYTGPLTVPAGTTATADELNYIAKKTTGTVTAELVNTTPITKATVDALKDVNSSDIIKFEPTPGTVSGKAALEALVALGKKLPNTDWTGVTDFEGTASEVAAIKAALKVVEDANVTIAPSGQISAADANALVVASNGIVTATIKDGSVAATLKALKDVDGDLQANVLTFKSTDKTADAKALVDLEALVDSATSDFSSVLTITSKAADIETNGVTNVTAALVIVPGAAVTITNGTISAKAAAAISNATLGKVTANITPDTAANIADATNGLGAITGIVDKDALNITVNGATATATELNTIDTKTALKVKVDAATVTAANYAQFEGIYVTNKNNFSNLGDENITVTAGVNSAQADTVAKATSKVVTATITGESAANVVTNLKNANAKDAFTITLTNVATSAKDLLTLDGKTSKTVDASAIITAAITGTVAEVNKLLDADVSLAPNAAFTLTGTVKAADANYIALKTNGIVTATIAADTAAKLDKDLADAKNTDLLKLTVNGATASVAELTALNLKTGVDIKVDAKEITGTGALLATLYAPAAGFTGLGDENVRVTDTAGSLANINAILGGTTGVVTAAITAGTATALLAGLTNATSNDALTLTTTNAAAIAAELLALDNATSVKVNATAIVANGISGTAADLKQLVASKGVELAKNVAITVSGTANTAADVNTIAKATTGVVTATVKADSAAALNKALTDKDVNALTLTVNSATATAKDLIELAGKTSVASGITVSAVTSITGNITEVTKLFVTNKADFTGLAAQNVTISGTVTAAEAEVIAGATTGVVTATIAADTVSKLDAALTETGANAHALKLTTKGDDTTAADLNSLDTKTTVAINANSIKNIDGTTATGAADVNTVYSSAKAGQISGLGNETVDLTGATDANVALVNAINGFTTGVITLPELTFGATATTFALKNLGDLKGITGLVEINAKNGGTDVKDIINISLKDLLEANDSKTDFTLNITTAIGGATLDVVNLTNDVSGWTGVAGIGADANKLYTYTNDKTHQVVTITANEAIIA